MPLKGVGARHQRKCGDPAVKKLNAKSTITKELEFTHFSLFLFYAYFCGFCGQTSKFKMLSDDLMEEPKFQQYQLFPNRH